jgi:CRISPR/Cas system CSM-associated protein Csm4 (group 5 of RAMP superfamily)
MSIENDLKSGKFLGLDALQKLVNKRKDEKKNIRGIVKERQDHIRFTSPRANISTLAKGIELIRKEYPDAAKLLATIIVLTQKFTRTHEQAIEIIALETKKPIWFVYEKEKEAVRMIMDKIESSAILQLA